MTPERKARYIEGLRQSASHRYAAKFATGPDGEPATDPQQSGYAASSFRLERRLDPDFNAACEQALTEALGRLEQSIMERAFTPDRRKNYDARSGALTGESENWEPANRLARAILARHLPDEWAELERREITSTVTVNNGGNPPGHSFVVTPSLTRFLDENEKLQLSTLMRAMIERSEADQQQIERRKQNQLTDQSHE
jgi:hypothetical protein